MSRGMRGGAYPDAFRVQPDDGNAPRADSDRTTGVGEASQVPRAAYLALATGSLAFVLATMNVTITNVAFTDIKNAFPAVGTSLKGWILTGYSLGFSATMLVGGRLADRYGRLLVFRIGLSGLLLSSLLAGLAPDIWTLLSARGVQGMCGALTVPSSLALVLDRFPPARRASVIGIWAAAGMVASGLAPGLAAFVLEVANWRWIYLVLVPIAALGLLGSTRYMAETVERDLSRPLDLLGMGMGSGAVFLIVLATLQSPVWGWGSISTIGCLTAAAALLPLFVARSNRHDEPLFDPRLFRIPSFAVSNVAVGLAMVNAFTSWFLWPQFLREVWGYSNLQVGLAFTPSPIVSAAVAIAAGRWADRHGFRGLMTLAAAVATLGNVWMYVFMDEEVNFWFAFFPATVWFGLGMGVLASQLNSAALRDIAPQSLATANGVHQSLRYAVGGAGVAIAIAVINDTHEVWRYDAMWLGLGISQFLVVPLFFLTYPRGRA